MAANTKALNKVLKMGDVAVKYMGNDRFEWQQLVLFLAIAMTDGEVSFQELEKRTGASQAATSRNIAKLGQGITMHEPGARLIEAYEDPAYRRRKLVRLTALGREFREELSKEALA